jgi:uncharacterized protein
MWSAARRVVGQMVLAISLAIFSLSHAAAELEIPPLTGRVVDKAGILSDATELALSAKIEVHERATADQIVIVTLPDLMDRPIEDWSLMLGRSWAIGQQGKDNGIIFLVAPNDRELRIEVGYGLEGSLPDATANKIIQSDVIPHFKQGDMEAGVTAGLDGILAALGGTYQPAALPLAESTESFFWKWADTLIPVCFFVVMFVIALLMNLRRRWDKTRQRHVWYLAPSTGSSSGSSSSSFGRSSSSGFSGGGGSFGGGGASGKW